jgi:hypothetical protein
MRIGDYLYFAPGVRFSQLDLSGPGIAEQYEARIRGFYLDPAYELACARHAFASGLLLVACIDALAGLRYKCGMGQRFKQWLKEELAGCFTDDDARESFYEDFRNGLVHEARIKKGGEFSLEQGTTVTACGGSPRINPLHLWKEVSAALSAYVKTLREDEAERTKFVANLRSTFEQELT